MRKKDTQFTLLVDFKDQNPEMLIRTEKPDPLYERAFLSRDEQSRSEHAQNTTTWD